MSISSKNADILRNANLRLCRLRIWPEYDGFGFSLVSPFKPPYSIQHVEPFTPAAAGGLKPQDIILAINNQDITSSDNNQVIDAIKYARDSNVFIELLVIEPHLYLSLTKKNIKFDLKFASIIDTPQMMPIDYLKYQPRSCEIYLNRSHEIFGFDLFNNENDTGVYIEKIHPNTPASRTLLRQYDRIIEINDEYVNEKLKKSIYKRLDRAKLKGYVKLYVMDIETYKYYQMNNIPLSSKTHRNNRIITINRRPCKFSYLFKLNLLRKNK
jgi:C-terminal processing protease CtpA/Prc